ncbi:MAG: phosphoribosylformylglycinamidine synthase, partial [Marinoscillum sp.]
MRIAILGATMIHIFQKSSDLYYIVGVANPLNESDKNKLQWLFSGAHFISETEIKGDFIGPRKEMITPWSTNAVEITQNAGIEGIERIESFS